jgi:hypothetical protein
VKALRTALCALALALPPHLVAASPFADVPSDRWAYGAIQTLAADGLIEGYPDGSFKGDRPLTRYEMAAIVARVVAKIEAEGASTASRADLETLQKLVDALKDELDALGVRVTTLEDAVASLDRRTKLAQALALHGDLRATGLSVQRPSGLVRSPVSGIVNAYETSSASNNPIDQQNGPQSLLRNESTITLSYALDPNLIVSIPIHLENYAQDGEFSSNPDLRVEPDLVVQIARSGSMTNLELRAGRLDDLHSSLTGLTYRAPQPSSVDAAGFATQPWQRGFEASATFGGTTDVQLAFAQDDPTFINTQPYVAGVGDPYDNGYFTYVHPPQTGYAQFGPPGATSGSLGSDTFSSAGALSSVYLRRKAVAGSVYVAALSTPSGSATFDRTGAITGGAVPGNASAPPFVYLDGTNQVVFPAPLPPGSTVTIAYVGLGYANQIFSRYEAHLRVEHHLVGLPGATIGFTAHRLWDETGPVTTGDATDPYAGLSTSLPGTGATPVTDQVFGFDVQVPLASVPGGATRAPYVFAEVATSRFTPNLGVTPAVDAPAGIAGLRFTLGAVHGTLSYQDVAQQYLDGAPFRYFGNAPPTFANYQGAAFPQFFGFANTLGINQTFDASIAQTGRPSATASAAALTFLYPVFNPFVASGPDFYSAYAPNTQGPSLVFGMPLAFGGFVVHLDVDAQHLVEVQANANATSTFGPQFASAVRAQWDHVRAAATFDVPFFGRGATADVTGTYEHLARNDRTAQIYVPTDPSTGAYDAAALANFIAAGGRVDASGHIVASGASSVAYYPNYVNLTHTVLGGGLAWPVGRDVTAAAHFSDQRYTGAAGTTLQTNIGGTKDELDLDLTYALPNTKSTVGLGYRLSSYRDATLPSNNLVQSQEHVNFAIHF